MADPGKPAVLDLERRRGDTFVMILRFSDKATQLPLDISAMTAIRWVADERKFPDDVTTEVFDITGTFVTDGTDGKVAFAPSDTDADHVGTFYQEIQWTDGASDRRTVAEGKLRMIQDRAKNP